MKQVLFSEVVWFQEGPGVRNTQYTNSGVKLLNVANLVDGRVDLSNTDRYISEEEAYGKYRHFLVDDGDFIIASSGIKVEYFEKKMGFVSGTQLPLCMNTSTIRFKALDKNILDIRYFMHFLKTDQFKQQLSREITGSAQLNFGPSHLKKMYLPLIDLTEQRKIVAALDKVSDLIAKRRQQLDKLDELVKARFVEMFGDEHHLDSWNCVSVGDIADICVGVVIKPTQYYTDQSGTPAFRSLNVGAMTIKNTDWVYFTKEGHEKNKKSIVRENDVLVIRSGAPGTACIVTKEFAGYNAVDIIIAHPNTEKINPVFLAMFTNMPHGMNQIREKTGGAAQQHFNVGGYKSLTVILPPIELQDQFAAFVKQTEKAKKTIRLSLDNLETLKKSLMQKYFE